MPTLQERFVQAVASSPSGVSVKQMAKVLKTTEQSVYQTANAIRNKGGKVEMKDYRYVVASFPGTSLVPIEKGTSNKELVSMSKKLIEMAAELDPTAKHDFVEQMTKAHLHQGIAEQIVKSHVERQRIARKVGL